MYDKIYNIWDKLWKLKSFVIIFIINLSIICAIATAYDKWGNFFTFLYPEEVYQKLEKEADKMNNSGIFKSETYQLDIIDYDSRSNKLVMKLSEGTHYINITINNNEMENQEIITERGRQPDKEYISSDILFLVLFSMILTSIEVIIIIIIFSLIFLIFRILD